MNKNIKGIVVSSLALALIAGIVTEKGICRPPYTKSLKALFDDKK